MHEESPAGRALESATIRVLVAHDHASLRRDIVELIGTQADMTVIGEIEDGSEVVAAVEAMAPDVAVLDPTMAGVGLRALEQIAARAPNTKSVVLALDDSNLHLLRSVLAFGGLGYVVHALAHAELISVIRKVVAGRSYIDVPTGGLPLVEDRTTAANLAAEMEKLSRRELQVLEAVAYGYTNREVADWLSISVKSVETYRFRLSEKLSFKSRADLVRFALEAGLLDIGRGDPLAVAP